MENTKHIPELDGVRGIAIALVLLHHFALIIAPISLLEYVALKAFIPLWCGVNLFFVLSGFLITGILIDSKGLPNYFVAFYIRRVLRIFPLYYGFLLVCLLYVCATRFTLSTRLNVEWIWYFTYLYNWRAVVQPGPPHIQHLWSLAVEEQFYLIWPLIVYAVPNIRLPLLCIALAASSAILRASVVVLGLPGPVAYYLTPMHVEDLTLGALAAVVVRDPRLILTLRWIKPLITLGCVGVALTFFISRGFEANKPLVLTVGTSSLNIIFFGLILKAALVRHEKNLLTRSLRSKSLRWLGKYSYGAYIFHLPIAITAAEYFRPRLPALSMTHRIVLVLTVMSTGIVLSCLLAYISYHLLEKRFLALKRLFTPGWKPK